MNTAKLLNLPRSTRGAPPKFGDPSARNTCSQILSAPINPYRSRTPPTRISWRASFTNKNILREKFWPCASSPVAAQPQWRKGMTLFHSGLGS